MLAGLVISTLVLNTIAFVLSILLLVSLPDTVTATVRAYASILIALTLLAWLILLAGGSAILHLEQTEHAPMSLKLGIMLTTLIIYTVVFILSCLLLSVLQNDLLPSLVAARNYTAGFLVANFAAWTVLLAASALQGRKQRGTTYEMTTHMRPMPLPKQDAMPYRTYEQTSQMMEGSMQEMDSKMGLGMGMGPQMNSRMMSSRMGPRMDRGMLY